MLLSEDIVVRRARTEDIDVLTDLAIRTFRDTYEAHNDSATIREYTLTSELLAEA